ncbi:MAG: hypothetical protein ABH818_00550 [Patescibacteria group bacterium]|nr:hypothetical protein [Patescibacteria group bacterium]MBU1870508.1 hypothetical protein [Patescibacteria group bacterium]
MLETKIKTETENFKNNKIFNWKIVNQIIFILIIFLGGYYLSNINDLMVKNFNREKLKEKNKQLVKENENLEVAVLSLGSYGNINARIKNLKMVVAKNIDYITVEVAVVAKK